MPACAACGTDNPDDSRFCTSCGAPLAECRSCHFVNRAGDRFCSRCGTALGDVATTVSHPALSSHRGLSAQQRAVLGISDGLVRVSVGIERVDDLRDEFAAALG